MLGVVCYYKFSVTSTGACVIQEVYQHCVQFIDLLYETSASCALSCGNKFNKAINVANILMINSHVDVIVFYD